MIYLASQLTAPCKINILISGSVVFVFWGKGDSWRRCRLRNVSSCGLLSPSPRPGIAKQNSMLCFLFLRPLLRIVHLGVRQICLRALSNQYLRRQIAKAAYSIFSSNDIQQLRELKTHKCTVPTRKTLRLWVICQPRSFRLLQEAVVYNIKCLLNICYMPGTVICVFCAFKHFIDAYHIVKARDAVERIRLPV